MYGYILSCQNVRDVITLGLYKTENPRGSFNGYKTAFFTNYLLQNLHVTM